MKSSKKCMIFGGIILLNMVSFGVGFYINHILYDKYCEENGSESI